VQLRQHGITHVIFVGLIANTCIETSARHAAELGYHVTLVRDATAAMSPEAMHAAHDINGPAYAHAIVTTAELLQQLNGGDVQ
jgi:nicotinamidase-related amidase